MWEVRELITITSCTQKRATKSDLMIHCADLPNPHQVPALRPRDGRDHMVKDWLLNQPGVQDFIDRQVRLILNTRPDTVTTTCAAGKHRSVMIAEAIAQALETQGQPANVKHRELGKPRKPRGNDGMGSRHQRQRQRLNAQLIDGTPCWWCGRPMDRTHDLHADHSESRKFAGPNVLADRLLHGACNEQRGHGGDRDHRRPILGAEDAFEMLPIRLKGGGIDDRHLDEPKTPDLHSPTTWFKWA